MNDHDETDYDGMGNYGRFPEPKPEPPTATRSDLVLIFGVLMFVVIYIFVR